MWSTRRKRKGEEMMERKEKREIVELYVDLTLPRRSGQDLLAVDDLVINTIDHSATNENIHRVLHRINKINNK